MAIDEIYRLSTYKDISVLSDNTPQKILLVLDELTNKLYVRKMLPGTDHYNFYIRLASLKHKNLVKIHDVICSNGYTYIFEEYTNGQTLQSLLQNEGVQQENKALEYILQICDALSYLHSQSPPIIHRDIKPENIMLSDDDVIKLIDFDIAREFKQHAKRDTIFMGTKEYAAPEQYGYKQTDSRTDIYAIGVLLYEMLTGRLPQNNITYKGSLHKIIKKCLQLEPDRRYQNVSALKKALSNTRYTQYKKKGILSLFTIIVIATVIIFSSKDINDPDAASYSPQTITSNENDTITITSEDGIFTTLIPSDWNEDNTINEAASLQASKSKTSSYFILITDYKDDLDYTFESWKEHVLSNFYDVEDLEISDEIHLNIDGRPAVQQTLTGVNAGTKVKLLLTYVDGADYYGQIICGSTTSAYEQNKSAFELMIYSIKGL